MRDTVVVVGVIILSLALGTACGGAASIYVDERDDFIHYRTWSWLSDEAPAVEGPARYVSELGNDLPDVIERELERRGFQRADRNADLRIGVVLKLRRDEVKVYEAGAIEHVASLSHSPNYQMQVTVERREIQERSRFVLVAIDARSGKVVWRGALEQRIKGGVSPHVEQTVASLLDHFPPPGHSAEPTGPNPDQTQRVRTLMAANPSEPSEPEPTPSDLGQGR